MVITLFTVFSKKYRVFLFNCAIIECVLRVTFSSKCVPRNVNDVLV